MALKEVEQRLRDFAGSKGRWLSKAEEVPGFLPYSFAKGPLPTLGWPKEYMVTFGFAPKSP